MFLCRRGRNGHIEQLDFLEVIHFSPKRGEAAASPQGCTLESPGGRFKNQAGQATLRPGKCNSGGDPRCLGVLEVPRGFQYAAKVKTARVKGPALESWLN